jgi:hypothetical protein
VNLRKDHCSSHAEGLKLASGHPCSPLGFPRSRTRALAARGVNPPSRSLTPTPVCKRMWNIVRPEGPRELRNNFQQRISWLSHR